MLERLADQVASTTPTSTSGLRKVNCGRGGWRLEAVLVWRLQLTWTMYMQSCCSSAGSQVRLVSTLSTRNTVKVVRQPHSVPRGMFLAGDTRSPDLNSIKEW